MDKTRRSKLCVYCGSKPGADPAFLESARQLGRAMAAAGIDLVYGGGSTGLMGALAETTKLNGGRVVGIMPTALLKTEILFEGADERHVVTSYHERKRFMLELSDGFVVLAGGPGTLEEMAEQWAWSEFGYHQKPIYVVNTRGYWSKCLSFLERMREEGFTTLSNNARFIVINEPTEVIPHFLHAYR